MEAEEDVCDAMAMDVLLDSDQGLDLSAIVSMDEMVDPPTPEIAAFDPFVRWLLGSTLEELTSPSSPFMLYPSPEDNNSNNEPATVAEINGTEWGQAQLDRADIEGQLEAATDLLSVAYRECAGVDEQVKLLEDERGNSNARIALLEARIVKHLQDRDLAIAEKYTTEKLIVEAEAYNKTNGSNQHHLRTASAILSGLWMRSKTVVASAQAEKELQRLQTQIADTKVATALAKTELDAHYYKLRQLEQKCAHVKLEIAQASALEDDLMASLDQLARERRQAAEQLQHVSRFSAACLQARRGVRKLSR